MSRSGRRLLAPAVVAFLASGACSFRGGDFTPMQKEPDTACYKEAKEICKDKLGSADGITELNPESIRGQSPGVQFTLTFQFEGVPSGN